SDEGCGSERAQDFSRWYSCRLYRERNENGEGQRVEKCEPGMGRSGYRWPCAAIYAGRKERNRARVVARRNIARVSYRPRKRRRATGLDDDGGRRRSVGSYHPQRWRERLPLFTGWKTVAAFGH